MLGCEQEVLENNLPGAGVFLLLRFSNPTKCMIASAAMSMSRMVYVTAAGKYFIGSVDVAGFLTASFDFSSRLVRKMLGEL